MVGKLGAGGLIVAVLSAGMMALIVMLGMSTIQPVLVDVAEIIASVTSADAAELTDFTTKSVVPIMPIALPIITFFGVLYRASRGEKII